MKHIYLSVKVGYDEKEILKRRLTDIREMVGAKNDFLLIQSKCTAQNILKLKMRLMKIYGKREWL